jgi:mycothiol synthase
MGANGDKSVIFRAATAVELPAALELLFSGLPEELRAAQIKIALEEIEKSHGEGQILLAGRRGDRLVAAIWAQIRAGRVASLWPPGLATGESAATAAAIIDLAADKAAAAGARVVQSLLETDAGPEAKWLRLYGFQHIADLLYLVSLREDFPNARPESELEFEPLGKAGELGISETQTKRLVGIIRLTYIDTQDCPAVHGMRAMDDVLATYRAVGQFNHARWFFVRRKSADIGCLIMASHAQEENCELIYMGIAPEARGNGFGLEIVRYAQWLAGKCEGGEKIAGEIATESENTAARMILAVDAANSPAIATYAAAGFQTWDRRSAFLRKIAEKI